MTLDDLIDIRRAADSARHAAGRAERAQQIYAALRTSDLPAVKIQIHGNLPADDRDFLEGVFNEFAPEILRVAEMRKSAYVRDKKAKARVIDAQIAAFLGEPEAGKEAA